MNFYHVVTAKSKVELDVIRELKPPRLLLSHFYFRNKSLEQFINAIGYKPEIIYDSGAFSAYTQGKDIALTNYMNYIQQYQKYIEYYISLDVIFDSLVTLRYWQIMREKGFDPIPVFHYKEDESILDLYSSKTSYIALGGTVPEKNKTKVAEWVNRITKKYPSIKFHLLGSSSPKIINVCELASADSASWILQAINGNPKAIKGKTTEAKKERALYNLKKELMDFSTVK